MKPTNLVNQLLGENDEKLLAIVRQFMEEQIGVEHVNVNIGTLNSIIVRRKQLQRDNKTSENEWQEMAMELTQVLASNGFPGYGVYNYDSNGLQLSDDSLREADRTAGTL